LNLGYYVGYGRDFAPFEFYDANKTVSFCGNYGPVGQFLLSAATLLILRAVDSEQRVGVKTAEE
jgi:hypothetical protein